MTQIFTNIQDIRLIYDILENDRRRFCQSCILKDGTEIFHKERLFPHEDFTELYKDSLERFKATPHRSLLRILGGWQEGSKYVYGIQSATSLSQKLDDRIWDRKYLGQEELEVLSLKIIKCLADLQRQEICHGMVNPDSIFYTEEDEIKLGESDCFMGIGLGYTGNYSAPEVKIQYAEQDKNLKEMQAIKDEEQKKEREARRDHPAHREKKKQDVSMEKDIMKDILEEEEKKLEELQKQEQIKKDELEHQQKEGHQTDQPTNPEEQGAVQQTEEGDSLEISITEKLDRYKSDVYSLGLTLLFLSTFKEITDLSQIPELLKQTETRYGENIKSLIASMLRTEVKLRPNFIELEGQAFQIKYKRDEDKLKERLHKDGLQMKLYLDHQVMPLLMKGLAELTTEKPQDPVHWLGTWLLKHDPQVL